MAASAASAMATAGQAKKKTKKNDDLQHKLRSSAHLHEFVENDRSHVNHFWESVRTSVRASNGCEGMGFRNATKISDLEAADSKTNREVRKMGPSHATAFASHPYSYVRIFGHEYIFFILTGNRSQLVDRPR